MKVFQDPVWQAKLTAITQNYREGDIISHQKLNEIFGIEEPEFSDFENAIQYKEALQSYQLVRMTLIERLKHDLLVGRQCYLDNVFGEGYRIVPAKDQAATAYKKATRNIHSEFEDGRLAMDNIRQTALNAEEKRRTNDIVSKFALLQTLFENNK